VAQDQAQRRRYRRVPGPLLTAEPGTSCKQLSWREPRSPVTPGWRDLAGRCRHARPPATSAPPTNPAPEPISDRQPDPVGPTLLALSLAPGGLAARHGVHRPPVPRAGQTPSHWVGLSYDGNIVTGSPPGADRRRPNPGRRRAPDHIRWIPGQTGAPTVWPALRKPARMESDEGAAEAAGSAGGGRGARRRRVGPGRQRHPAGRQRRGRPAHRPADATRAALPRRQPDQVVGCHRRAAAGRRGPAVATRQPAALAAGDPALRRAGHHPPAAQSHQRRAPQLGDRRTDAVSILGGTIPRLDPAGAGGPGGPTSHRAPRRARPGRTPTLATSCSA
jgi:hypothetical protein